MSILVMVRDLELTKMTSQSIMIISIRKLLKELSISKCRIKGRRSTETTESKLVPGPGAYTPYIESVVKREP